MLPYINVINCMDRLVTACFSIKLVKDDIDKLIYDLRDAVLDTDLTI